MESAIKTVVSTYLKSAKGKDNLSGKDFQSMIKSQLGNILSDAESSKAVKELQQGLDDNADGKVSFQEYMKLIGYLANSMSEQHVVDRASEKANGEADGEAAVTQAEAPAANNAEPAAAAAAAPAAEEPAAAAAAAPATDAEAEKKEEEAAPAEEAPAAEEKTEEEAS